MTNISKNPNWPRVARLCPQLRSHICTFAQEYRGERWYVLWDQSNRRHLRFSATAYAFIARLDGKLTVEETWYKTIAGLKEVALTQDEVLLILTQLFAVDILRSDLPVEATHFFNRYQRDRQIRRRNTFINPLSVRVPLMDPNRILNYFMPWLKPVYSRPAALVWFLVIGFAVLLTLANFQQITASINPQIVSPTNLLSMLMVFIVIKAVHEFAHAFTVKMWGGDVHEMGVTFLVFAPIPYVDASSAWAFRDKYKRMLVGAAGIVVELFIAAVALIVWLLVEPGLVKDAAFNAILIASVSTVLFNGNPLLRFDAYYVLQDWIEIPNLATRASRYYLYLIRHYLFGVDEEAPVNAKGERPWLVIYGLAAFIYRLFILTVIVLFLAEEYLFAGVALGMWAVTLQIVVPLVRGCRFIMSNPAMVDYRHRAFAVTSSSFVIVALLLLFIPVTLNTRAEGVVWVSDQAQLYTGTAGLVDKVLISSGTEVEAGDAIIQMRSPELDARIAKLEAQLRELDAKSAAEYLQFKVQSKITAEERKAVKAELDLLIEQHATLLIRSQSKGRLVFADEWRLKGAYLDQGVLLGYVVNPQKQIVRAVVPQSDIGLLRQVIEGAEVRLSEQLGQSIPVSVSRITPAGSYTLPNRALGASGGGAIAVRDDNDGLTALEKVFQVDLILPADQQISGVGERAYVLFKHGAEPLAIQWFRSIRQLLLRRLSF